jgi:hypothetical protein
MQQYRSETLAETGRESASQLLDLALEASN